MRIIPAIDLIDGKCVRLTQGKYDLKTIYNENPLEVAKQFEDHGIKYLHLVDLDGAKAGKITNYKILEEISAKTNLKIDFGGGLKTDDDIIIAFNSGANQVTGGSIAVKNAELFQDWLEKYGGDKIILGSDVKGRKIATHAWQQTSDREIFEFLNDYIQKGIKYTICTDVSKDGMLAGPATDLYVEILQKTNVNLIASGGITTVDDVQKMMDIGCEGAIIGKAIYENKISLKDLEKFL